jgi:hypothetical protein
MRKSSGTKKLVILLGLEGMIGPRPRIEPESLSFVIRRGKQATVGI